MGCVILPHLVENIFNECAQRRRAEDICRDRLQKQRIVVGVFAVVGRTPTNIVDIYPFRVGIGRHGTGSSRDGGSSGG